jgi:integrase
MQFLKILGEFFRRFEMTKLTKTIVEGAAPQDKAFTLWCSDLPGFGVYVLPTGNRSYFVDYRNAKGTRRRLTIGRHGALTAETARKLAVKVLGEAVRGEDPAEERLTQRKSLTVKELCTHYMSLAEKGLIMGKRSRPKKASTLYVDKGRIARHIVPLLGTKRVRDLTPADINRFIRDVASGKTAVTEKTQKKRGKSIVEGGKGTATRTAGLLGGILTFAVSEGIIPTNPSIGVKRPADNHRVRRLSPEEYRQLGKALEAAEAADDAVQGITAIRLLALTGCRSGEILGLKWQEVDKLGNCLRLADSKEGASIRPIGETVFQILDHVDRIKSTPYVLTSLSGTGPFGGLTGAWQRAMARSKLVGVTPHTLRHSYASVAGDLGFTEFTIAALLGHSAGSVTSRYVHHLDSVLISAADKVAAAVHKMMSEDRNDE